jgi:hypothetical protein
MRNLTIDRLRFHDDEFDFELQTDMFTVDHFKRMIRKTFTDYHPGHFNLTNINLDDYVKVVEEQELVTKYGSNLEGTEHNVLTLQNQPWFDLGDLPETYDPTKDEAFQVVLAPVSKPPKFVVCKFNEYKTEFKTLKLTESFHEFDFVRHGITQDEVMNTLKTASAALEPFHGVMSKKFKIKYLIVAVAFVVFLGLALLAGLVPTMNEDPNNKAARWFWPLFIMIVFIIGFFVLSWYLNRQMSAYYRMAHFVLAVFCRAENNRLYLKHGIEVRPGYNALWLTFEMLDSPDMNLYVKNARQRFLKPALEYRQKIFAEQIQRNPLVVAEQAKIESEIRNQARPQVRVPNEEDIERAEVVEALAEQHNQDYYSAYLASQNQSAQAFVPPPTIKADAGSAEKVEKKKRRKKKKPADEQ